MTNKFIKSLLDKLNKNRTYGLIHLRPLTAYIELATVWTDRPKPSDDISLACRPHKFYFIKNKEGKYVAAVLDMWRNLHWFVDKKHRHQGHLTHAMKQAILFHLFQDRSVQRVTIDKNLIGEKDFIASKTIALSLGFEKIDDTEFVLNKTKYPTSECLHGENTTFSEVRLEEIMRQISYAGHYLWFIQTELEMKLGITEFTKDLKELVNEIRRQPCRLENSLFQKKIEGD